MAESSEAKRWEGVQRPYSRADVEKLRGSLRIEYTLATTGAKRLFSPILVKIGDACNGLNGHNRQLKTAAKAVKVNRARLCQEGATRELLKISFRRVDF